MRLLRLQISGFKSFCDKTTLSFAQNGISVVVGPNGCGKSNIIDAIRWTIGEQSAKHLRGVSMEDVIFSGSEERKPISMAQVILTFSNSEHDTLEKYREFEEISITRRLYRSGESIYMINNTPCRLMDIRELFMDTGVSGKGYSIIEQGRISQIITSKPLERRAIIDEAAGIVKFKAKRIEAEKKIEQTQQNLLRVEDICNELSLQETSLKQQVEKFEEYTQLEGKIEHSQKCIFAKQWEQLQEEIVEFNEQKEDLSLQQLKYKNHISALETKQVSFKLDQAELESKLEKKLQQKQTVKEKIQEKETTLQLNKQAFENILAWKQKGKEETETFQNKIHTIESQIKQNTTLLKTLDKEIEIKQEQIETLHEEKLHKQRVLENQSHDLETMRSKQLQVLQQLNSYKNEFNQKKEHVNQNKSLIKDWLEKSQAYLHQIEHNCAQLEISEKNLKQLNQKKESLLFQDEEVSLQKEVAEKSKQNYLEQLQQKKIDLNKVITKLESLSELKSSFQEQNVATQTFLQFLQKNETIAQNLGYQGLFFDFLEPDDTLPSAVLSYLDSFLNVLVFSSKQKFPEILQLSKELKLGQVELLFCDFLETEPLNIDKNSIYYLFKHSLKISPFFCKDILFSEKKYSNLNNIDFKQHETWIDPEYTIVTENIVKIGKPNQKTQLNQILERKQAIQFLSQQEMTLKKELTSSEKNYRKCLQTTEENQGKKEAITKKLNQLELEYLTLQQEEQKISEEIQRIETEQKNFGEIKKKKETENQKIETRILELSKFKLDTENEEKSLFQKMETLQKLIEDSKIEYEEIRDEQQHFSILLHQKLNEKKNIENTLNEFNQKQDELIVALKKSEEKTKENQEKMTKLDHSLQEVKQVLPTLIDELASFENEIKIEKNKIEEIKMELDCFQDEIKTNQTKSTKIEQEIHQIELKITESEQKAKNIEENLYSEYSVVPQEIFQAFDIEEFNIIENQEKLKRYKSKFKNIPNVNLAAKTEYQEVQKRLHFLTSQSTDLKGSIEALYQSIQKMDRESKKRFKETFQLVNEKFKELFPKMFGGGKAGLELTDEDHLLETGIEIIAQPPGKRLQRLDLLSGGEKALTAISLIFSIFLIKPSPFCVLDEVDAPLDDANVIRFNEALKEMTKNSQFIVITHHKKTMESADRMFGITMQEPGVSTVVSVNFNQYFEKHLQGNKKNTSDIIQTTKEIKV